MLDKKIFLKGLKYIYDYYTKFDFDIKNEDKVAVWYEVFQGFEDEKFANLIKSYCVSNQYAPQSPTSIINFYKDTMSLGELTGGKAWQIGYEAIKQDGFRPSRTVERLKDQHPIISKTLDEMKHKFMDLKTDDLKWVEKEFVELYDKNLKTQLNEKISSLQIGFNKNLMIGE